MILVPLLNPKFATVRAEKSCELRVRGTSANCNKADGWRRRLRMALSGTMTSKMRRRGGIYGARCGAVNMM
jgi:hypothetical protein